MLDFALDDRVFITNKMDAFIQELDILFNTSKTELLGDTDFGSSFVDFLWDFNTTPQDVIQYTHELIQNNCYYASKFVYSVDCIVIDGEYRDVYVLQITIKDKEEVATKTYQFR